MGESAESDGNIIQLIINDLKVKLRKSRLIDDWGIIPSCLKRIISLDIQASAPVWEDFASKSGKLHTALRWVDIFAYCVDDSLLIHLVDATKFNNEFFFSDRATMSAADAFLEAFQRVADVANSSRGGFTVSAVFYREQNVACDPPTRCFSDLKNWALKKKEPKPVVGSFHFCRVNSASNLPAIFSSVYWYIYRCIGSPVFRNCFERSEQIQISGTFQWVFLS